MIRASVAMAVYNGEKYIREQIDSIIEMMNSDDELIISYDDSTDGTLSIIQGYAMKDNRVKIVFDKGKSVESNFNNAVANCSGKYIFLADQDDVWINDKINVVVEHFEKNKKCVVVIADGYDTDENLKVIDSMFEANKTTTNAFRNFVRGTYLGCQMAFTADIKDKIWPIDVQHHMAHDLLLGVKGARYGNVDLINKKLIYHRLHANNYSNTSKMNLINVIKNRWFFMLNIIGVVK